MKSRLDRPLFVTRPYLPSLEEYTKTLKRIWDSRNLTNNGPLHMELEKSLKEYLRAKNLTLFNNGHLALESAIRVLHLQGEVITTPFTFVSTAHAITMNGLTPVFCDINMDSFAIDASKIESLITKKTCAILPVHVYGYPCDVEIISKISKKYNLPVIYDAAHAFGVEINQTPICHFGDMSMLSFHATKVYHTIEGGALVYNNYNYKQPLSLIKNFGIDGPEKIVGIGTNAKMNEFQAAMGLSILKTINMQIAQRKSIYNIYVNELNCIDGVKIKSIHSNIKYNYSYAPIVIDEKKYGLTRDQLHDKLQKFGIYSRKYFSPLITSIEPYRSRVFETSTANYIADRILCLPIFADMKLEEANEVCRLVRKIKDL